MQRDDVLCRAALFPRFIKDGVFDIETLMRFSTVEEDSHYAMSVGSKFLLRTSDGVHNYGCAAAQIANDNFREKNGRDPEPLNEAVHYLGFYELPFHSIKDVRGRLTNHHLSVRWVPEHGQDAHFQVELWKTVPAGARQLRRDRVAARGFLSAYLTGFPERHVCNSDRSIASILNALELPTLPKIEASAAEARGA
ncbi:hypothetical protein [Tianweitania sediminis]